MYNLLRNTLFKLIVCENTFHILKNSSYLPVGKPEFPFMVSWQVENMHHTTNNGCETANDDLCKTLKWHIFWSSFRSWGSADLLCFGFLTSWSSLLFPLAGFYRCSLKQWRHYCNVFINVRISGESTFVRLPTWPDPSREPQVLSLMSFPGWKNHKGHNSDTDGIESNIYDREQSLEIMWLKQSHWDPLVRGVPAVS